MPFIVRTTPKVKEIRKVEDYLLKEKSNIKPKELYYAVGAGGIPPKDDGNKIFQKLSPEQIAKIMEQVGNNNKIFINKNFYNNLNNKFVQ